MIRCQSIERALPSPAILTLSIGSHPGVMRQARRFSMEKLESMLEGCFQADFAIKTGRMDDQDAVTVLVIRACEAG
jgi:DNA polymerase III delta subunit